MLQMRCKYVVDLLRRFLIFIGCRHTVYYAQVARNYTLPTSSQQILTDIQKSSQQTHRDMVKHNTRVIQLTRRTSSVHWLPT